MKGFTQLKTINLSIYMKPSLGRCTHIQKTDSVPSLVYWKQKTSSTHNR